jgi:ribosome-binding ATPase YchF (GTP1/OBG family)
VYKEKKMKLGIIGFPQSGKTIVFNALIRGDRPVTMSSGCFEVHSAVVEVPDPRVDDLARWFNPKKTT